MRVTNYLLTGMILQVFRTIILRCRLVFVFFSTSLSVKPTIKIILYPGIVDEIIPTKIMVFSVQGHLFNGLWTSRDLVQFLTNLSFKCPMNTIGGIMNRMWYVCVCVCVFFENTLLKLTVRT